MRVHFLARVPDHERCGGSWWRSWAEPGRGHPCPAHLRGMAVGWGGDTSRLWLSPGLADWCYMCFPTPKAQSGASGDIAVLPIPSPGPDPEQLLGGVPAWPRSLGTKVGRGSPYPSKPVTSRLSPLTARLWGPSSPPSPPPPVPLYAASHPPPTLSFYIQDVNLIFSIQILTGRKKKNPQKTQTPTLEIESTEVSFHSSEI